MCFSMVHFISTWHQNQPEGWKSDPQNSSKDKTGCSTEKSMYYNFYYILHIINKRNAPSTSRTSNLINFFFYNINLKRHVAEGLDIVIVKNMCNDVSLQIICIVNDHYRLVYYSDTIFTVVHWIQLASFSNVQVEKRQHQLREFLQIQVRPFKHLNNLHSL